MKGQVLIIGWILFLLGSIRYLFVIGAVDRLWLGLLYVGAIILLITLAVPSLLAWPEKMWMNMARLLGNIIFSAILTAVYFIFFLSVGLLMRWLKGHHPFYRWHDQAAVETEGWVLKDLPGEIQQQSGRKRPLLVQPFVLIGHFIRRGQLLFLPVLLLLMILGLILFFAQSSALAPFIYTIF